MVLQQQFLHIYIFFIFPFLSLILPLEFPGLQADHAEGSDCGGLKSVLPSCGCRGVSSLCLVSGGFCSSDHVIVVVVTVLCLDTCWCVSGGCFIEGRCLCKIFFVWKVLYASSQIDWFNKNHPSWKTLASDKAAPWPAFGYHFCEKGHYLLCKLCIIKRTPGDSHWLLIGCPRSSGHFDPKSAWLFIGHIWAVPAAFTLRPIVCLEFLFAEIDGCSSFCMLHPAHLYGKCSTAFVWENRATCHTGFTGTWEHCDTASACWWP